MGTDVEVHMEIKLHPYGPWEHYGHYSPRRDYDIFGMLAGIRGLGPPLVKPRGLPLQMSAVTSFHYDMREGHTPSWFTWDEVNTLISYIARHGQNAPAPWWTFERWLGDQSYLFGNGWEKGNEAVADLRMIFWFDC